MTKGEMLEACKDQLTLKAVAEQTVSCGKWKRARMQCGRCVPCLIRRAAFHAANMTDATIYSPAGADLHSVMEHADRRDDLVGMALAARSLAIRDVKQWVVQSGQLPYGRAERDALFDVASRGMGEVAAYLRHVGLLQQ
jgi:hypothetical protein